MAHIINFHTPFFTMKIMFHLLNWLFNSKGGNRIRNITIFPRYCSDIQGHSSNHIWWSTLLFVHFYIIPKWSIFHLVCFQRSCAATPIALKLKCLNKAGLVKKFSMAMWYLYVWITQSLLSNFATTEAPRPSPMFSYSCRIESLPAYGWNWIQYPHGIAITHNLKPKFMGLLCMYGFAPCIPK